MPTGPAVGLPIDILTVADSEHQHNEDFLLDLINDPELPAAPAVEAFELAAQCLALVRIVGKSTFYGTQQPFLIGFGNGLEVFESALLDEDFIGQALSWPVLG